jgi:hypothetical protein
MYGNMNFAKIADEFIVRGKIAQRDLFQLFYKANINNLNVRLKLFDTLVKSVVMYCSHIWGVAFPEKFKAFQCSYIRQIFKLPSYTRHWFLFLESICNRIELSLLKNTLRFYVKLLSKPKSSLMYECLQFLKTSECRTNMKFNWFRHLRTLLAKYDLEDLLENDLCTLTPEYLSTFKNKIWKRLEDTSNMFMQQIIDKMQCSNKNPSIQNIKNSLLY